ncbi:MAG: hypothetical protein ACREYE_12130 [Gammaproteobacteria bacterium]
MSHRLQVLILEDLDLQIRKAAQRLRMSKGAWVRQAIEDGLRRTGAEGIETADPLARLGTLEAPTGDIEQMLAEIEAGRA